jgi:hypothetical protein
MNRKLMDIIVAQEMTTRNARKIRWYKLTYGDISQSIVVVDPLSKTLHLDGLPVTDPQDLKYIEEAIKKAVR